MITEFKIVIKTKLNKRIVDGEDVTKQVDSIVHNAFERFVHSFMAGEFGIEEMELAVTDALEDNGFLPENFEGLSDLGEIMITTTELEKTVSE